MSSRSPESETKRTFVAVSLPDNVKAALASLRDTLRPVCRDARWVNPDSIHLTLKFLGDTPEAAIPEIAAALNGITAALAPFDVSLAGVGAFPHAKKARVFWVGVDAGTNELKAISREVDSALAPLGFPPESRPFSPHLTLARFKTPSPVPPEALAAKPPPVSFTATHVTLYESILRPEGAKYIALEKANLGG